MAARIGTHFAYATPHGPITIAANEQGITLVAFGSPPLPGQPYPSELTNRAATELLEYFAGKRRVFDVPLAPVGTPFQLAVWSVIERILYGQTLAAADVAALLDKPASYRAVGVAVHKNPLAVLVPDHRIVGANGRPLGANTPVRSALLALERSLTRDTP